MKVQFNYLFLFFIISLSLINDISSKEVKFELTPQLGVNPELLEYYKGKVFNCLRSGKQISIEQVNDDYCDCEDGTDEPGTSACNNGVFYCPNKGFKPTNLHTSLLNDGYCDCCDGSDEYLGKVKCNNNCNEMGGDLRKKREKEIETFTTGLSKKPSMESEAKEIWTSKSEELERLKKEIDPLNTSLKELESKRDEKQKQKDQEADALKHKRRRDKKEQEDKDKQEATAIGSINEEIQKDQETAGENNINNNNEVEENPKDTVEEQPPTSELLEALTTGKDDETLNDDDVDDDDDDKVDDSFFTMYLKQFSTLWKFVKQYLPQSSYYNLNDIQSLDNEISSQRESLRQKQETIEDIENLFKLDFGKNNIYLSLHGKCFDYKTKEYTYSFCPFNKALQGHTSLGKYEKWVDGYNSMLFEHGQQCWGGPKRSLHVTFECGADNEPYDVQEPSKCEYSMKFKTPAACDEEHLKILSLEKDHEL